MFRKSFLALILTAALLAACAIPGASPEPPQATPQVDVTPDLSQPVSSEDPTPTGEAPRSPLDPIPGEADMVRGSVFIDSREILILESFPVQVMLNLKGSLPTPCHQLRAETSGPDEQNRIQVEVYSLSDPEEVCIQIIEPFETGLNLGSFPSGTYSVWVNGEMVGEVTT